MALGDLQWVILIAACRVKAKASSPPDGIDGWLYKTTTTHKPSSLCRLCRCKGFATQGFAPPLTAT